MAVQYRQNRTQGMVEGIGMSKREMYGYTKHYNSDCCFGQPQHGGSRFATSPEALTRKRGVVWGVRYVVPWSYPRSVYSCRTNDGSSYTQMLTCVTSSKQMLSWSQRQRAVRMRVTTWVLGRARRPPIVAAGATRPHCTHLPKNSLRHASLTCTLLHTPTYAFHQAEAYMHRELADRWARARYFG